MASFTGLGDDMTNVAKSCAENIGKAEMAEFVMAQYDLIRGEAYAAKIENKEQESKNPQKTAAGKKASNDANSAFARLQSMLKAQG